MVFCFAIARVPVYTAISNYEVRVLNAFGVGVVKFQLTISFYWGGVKAHCYG